MSQLFSPLTIRTVEVRNRLWVAPMCQYSAEDGIPNDWHHVHLAQFASGGAGLVMAEATAVVPEGRITPEDTGIWNDEQRDAWRPIVTAIHDRGAVAAIQLAHAGRKASTYSPFAAERGTVPEAEGGWQTLAPSPVAFDGYARPDELERAEIDTLVTAFADGARRSIEAGFDVLEIHAAHGYLLHEFLSPLSNRRTDEYGGSLENRARLLLRIVEAVRAAAPDAPLFVRFSATDWAEGGWDVSDTATVAAWAHVRGADLVDVSSGGLVAHQRITTGPGYQVPFAREIRETTGLPVSAVGEITTGTQAEEILAAGAADAIMAGREWLRDPHFGLRAADELGEDAAIWPPQYVRARRR
ncbi:oxidoreductase [Microbacterium arborescens]|uniref:2,4-dienoyl-CoA reductase-like NADH-dependent reductase (Old Yellow Enzyme family) n=2 Tax=Microbacterium TaxID=33882 RepID=A0ABU1HZL9_9MICO|nr:MULTISPECIES: NADH:flavin oxidoreductase/NADH oxidase [Microbacterium]MDR6167090.1 2,4-dienoyl-CoA reductase-like NADH-dependent reductase (Old Yellow Enzyme family) [Microbacterium paludicola]OAZ43123.1 oxidoreductase [Microbacterium arborescens]